MLLFDPLYVDSWVLHSQLYVLVSDLATYSASLYLSLLCFDSFGVVLEARKLVTWTQLTYSQLFDLRESTR